MKLEQGSTLELRCVRCERCVACVIFTQGLAVRCERYVRCVKFYARPLHCVRCVVKETASYSSSKLNESDIVNRQSGGEKLKYILKFYIGGTRHVISRMRNDDLALCL